MGASIDKSNSNELPARSYQSEFISLEDENELYIEVHSKEDLETKFSNIKSQQKPHILTLCINQEKTSFSLKGLARHLTSFLQTHGSIQQITLAFIFGSSFHSLAEFTEDLKDDFEPRKMIRTLSLTFTVGTDSAIVEKFIQKLPQLKNVAITTKVTNLAITVVSEIAKSLNGENISRLSIETGAIDAHTQPAVAEFGTVFRKFKGLQEFRFNCKFGYSGYFDEMMGYFPPLPAFENFMESMGTSLAEFKYLQVLDVSLHVEVPSKRKGFANMFNSLKKLERLRILNLRHNHTFSPGTIGLPEFKTLIHENISDLKNLTVISINSFDEPNETKQK